MFSPDVALIFARINKSSVCSHIHPQYVDECAIFCRAQYFPVRLYLCVRALYSRRLSFEACDAPPVRIYDDALVA
jgi:hypothetical protein